MSSSDWHHPIIPQSSPSSQAEKHHSCLCRGSVQPNAALFLLMNMALNPNPLAKCKRGIRAHVKTAYSQNSVLEKAWASSWIHSKWQRPEPAARWQCSALQWAGLGFSQSQGAWRSSLLTLATEAKVLENGSFPLRAKRSTGSWQRLHAQKRPGIDHALVEVSYCLNCLLKGSWVRSLPCIATSSSEQRWVDSTRGKI